MPSSDVPLIRPITLRTSVMCATEVLPDARLLITPMTEFRSDFLRLMAARSQLHQITDEAGLDALMQKERVTAYIGFDCTAPSLHVGSLVQIMTLRRLQQTGHR